MSARGEVVGVVSRRVGSGGLSFAGTGGRLRQLLAGAPRRPPGGQVELSLVAGALDRGGVTGSLGGRLSVVLEDRLVVAAGVQAPLGRRWQTFRAGQTDAVRGDLRVGLHQRLGYGAWATRVQAWGGVVWIDRLVAGSAQEWARTYAAQPAVGGRVAVRGVGLEVGTVLGEAPALWGAVTLAWPGLVTVF